MRGRRWSGGCCCRSSEGIEPGSRDGMECGCVAWRESSEGRIWESMLIALGQALI